MIAYSISLHYFFSFGLFYSVKGLGVSFFSIALSYEIILINIAFLCIFLYESDVELREFYFQLLVQSFSLSF